MLRSGKLYAAGDLFHVMRSWMPSVESVEIFLRVGHGHTGRIHSAPIE